jgi:hypothetical protein
MKAEWGLKIQNFFKKNHGLQITERGFLTIHFLIKPKYLFQLPVCLCSNHSRGKYGGISL